MKILLAMLLLNLKTAVSMRGAFLLRLVFTVFNHTSVILVWIFFFKAVPIIYGWTIWHLLLAYGLAWFTWGFVSVFAYGFKMLPRTIEFGELDHFLLLPRPLLLTLATNNGEVLGIPDLVLGLGLIVLSSVKIAAFWPFVFFAIVSSAIIFTAFTLIISSLAFWLKDMHDFLLDTQYSLYVFASRPASAFSGAIKLLMFTIMPMGFISYLPVQVVRTMDPLLVAEQILGTLIVTVISFLIFRLGLKNYESGNRFGVRT